MSNTNALIGNYVIIKNAASWAIQKHKEVNHLYDNKAYDVHLWMVSDIAKMFIHWIPEDAREKVLAACWLHDTIEDCRVTYNDLRQEFGDDVAEIVYALTNEKGRTRKERANDKYYEGIRDCFYAPFVKLCDRAANIKYSYENGSSMYKKYCEENDNFIQSVDPDKQYYPLLVYLQSFINRAI